MSGVKEVFNFYINSSIHVSLAVVSLAVVTMINFDLPVEKHFLYFIFFASVTGYNFVKYAGIAKLHHLSLAKNLRLIQIFSLFVFLGLLYTLFFQSILVLLASAVLGILTLLYALPVFGNTNLRGLSGIKIYVIALVWAGATVLLPLAQNSTFLERDVIVTFIQRFCIVIALTIPFEIRDLKYDMAQLQTIPQQVGVLKSQIIGALSMCIFVLLEFLKETTTYSNAVSVIVVGALTIALLRYSQIRQSKYYASFWVEGVPVVWLICLLFISQII